MDGIYTPKDIHHNPYFIITDNDIFLNKECILTESDYERMCDIKGVNPIYPTETIIVTVDPKKEKVIKEKVKKESLKDLLARKRKELGHTQYE